MCVCDQLRRVVVPSGRQFVLHYDNSSRLTTLVTPNQRRHQFQRLIMPRIDRLLYRPPHARDPYVVDHDTRGRLLSVMYPARRRRLTYNYTSPSDDRDVDIFYDSTRVRHRTALLADYTLQTSSVHDSDVNCSCIVERTDNVTMTSVHVTSTASCTHHHNSDDVDALFVYTRDSQRRVTSVRAVVAGHKLPMRQWRYSDKSGQTTYATPFTCHRHRRRECVSDDGRLNVSRDYDDVDRLNKVIISFNSHTIFTLQVAYKRRRSHSQSRNPLYQIWSLTPRLENVQLIYCYYIEKLRTVYLKLYKPKL